MFLLIYLKERQRERETEGDISPLGLIPKMASTARPRPGPRIQSSSVTWWPRSKYLSRHLTLPRAHQQEVESGVELQLKTGTGMGCGRPWQRLDSCAKCVKTVIFSKLHNSCQSRDWSLGNSEIKACVYFVTWVLHCHFPVGSFPVSSFPCCRFHPALPKSICV